MTFRTSVRMRSKAFWTSAAEAAGSVWWSLESVIVIPRKGSARVERGVEDGTASLAFRGRILRRPEYSRPPTGSSRSAAVNARCLNSRK